jgi:tetratricopeptide (TPR) repeat protein
MSETGVLMKEAEESISSGQWDQAIEKLEELMENEVRTSDVFSKLAQANAVRGRFLTVLSVYLDWTDCAIESGDLEQAERALGYAQNLRPDSPEVHEMAVKLARQTVTPEVLADRLIELAHLHLEKGDGDRSVALIREAVEARPEDDTLTLQLGEVYISVGQINSGLKIFEDFVEKHSDCGEPSKLLEPLRRINLLKADDIDSTLHLGRIYLALGHVDKAEEQFRAVLRLDLNHQGALLELARVCQKKGLFRNGLLALNRVVQLNPELPIARRLMGELHLSASSPDEAVREFLEAARLYSDAEEIDSMIEVYRTVLRFDSDNSQALSRLRSLSFTENYDEDLTANLFPPVEPVEESVEESAEKPADDSTRHVTNEPDEMATRPGPIEPAATDTDDDFREVPLIEKKEKPLKIGLTQKRPALVRKSAYAQRGSSKPPLRPKGERGRGLRRGLGLKQGGNKPTLPYDKPRYPGKPATPPEPVIEETKVVAPPQVAANPISPVETSAKEPEAEEFPLTFDNETDLFKKPDSIFEEPETIFSKSELEIPAFEAVFEQETETETTEESNEAPFDLFDPDPDSELLNETSPTDLFEGLLEEDTVDPVQEMEAVAEAIEVQKDEGLDAPSSEEIDNLFETHDDESEAVSADSLELQNSPLPEETIEPEESTNKELAGVSAPVDPHILFPTDEEVLTDFEQMEKESIFNFDEDWMDFDEQTENAPLFTDPIAEVAAVVEETSAQEPVEVEGPAEEDHEKDMSWLFEAPDLPEQAPLEEPMVDNAPLSPSEPEEVNEDETDHQAEDLFPRATLEPAKSEEQTDPDFQWELDCDQPNEPEASPLFPIEETADEPLFPTEETVDEPLFPVEETVDEPLFPVEEAFDEPLFEVTEHDESPDFATLMAEATSQLVKEDDLNPETPELMQMLQETLPVPPQQAQSVVEEIEVEPKQEPEPEPVAIETENLVEEPAEILPEPTDVATKIEGYRNRLGTFPTDEEATLALADTCLQHGMLKEALEHYQRLQKANPGCLETSARIIKAALWMEDIPTVKNELWKAANLSFDVGDLKTCQDRLGDLLSLDREHKEARQLMVEVFLAGGQEKLAAWHLSQMVERAIAEEEYELAISSLKKLHDVSPSDAALEKLGELYQKQHQVRAALDIFRQLRTTHLDRKEHVDATRLARQVVELDPRQTSDQEVLIDLLLQQGQQSEVLLQRLDLAVLYREQDNATNAIELLQGILREDPEHLDAQRLLVELHLQERSLDLAEQHAESLAERFLEQKAYQKAIDLFEYWVGVSPSSPRARERLAQFYQLSGDLHGAKMEWMMVTESHQVAGDFQRAARSLERALELDPEQNEWRLRLALLKAQELGQVESSLQDFRLLFQADPTWRKATVCYLDLLLEETRMTELGEVLQVLERVTPGSELRDNVVTRLKEKMSDEPDNLVLAFGWGELCLALGMLDLAIEQFQRLRRHEEYQLHSYRLLGLCFSRKKGFNMVELALSQFRRGLALEVGSPSDRLELRYDLATVLKEHGREDEALEQLQQITSEDPNYRNVAALLAELGQA